jgi:hypothetical protein
LGRLFGKNRENVGTKSCFLTVVVLGWAGLGGAPGGIFGVFEIILLTIQVIVFPFYAAFQLWLLLLPIIIASAFEFPSTPAGSEFFRAFFSEAAYWNDYVTSIPWYVWVIQGNERNAASHHYF